MPRSARIRHGSDIRRLLREGDRKRTGNLDVFASASRVSRMRVGVVVPKHGHMIVERNRLRRRLREGLRTILLPRCGASGARFDVLVRARPSAYGATYRRLQHEIEEITEGLCSRSS